MGRGREATRRRRVDLDALRAALDDARAPRATARPVAVPPVELDDYDERAARAWRARARFDDVPEDPRRRRAILALIALLHIALRLALRYAMDRTPEPFATTPEADTVLEVTFADPVPPMADAVLAPEEPVATVDTARGQPDVRPPPRVERPAEPREAAMSARFIEAEPTPSPTPTPAPIRLFNRDGSLRLSQDVIDAADAKPEPGYRAPKREMPEFMKHKRAISDERTRFEKYWVPDGENLGQQIVRKYPLAAILLQGVNAPKCKPNSIAPECDDQPVPQRLDRVVPRDYTEDPGIPR
jgi:hypothetical protein